MQTQYLFSIFIVWNKFSFKIHVITRTQLFKNVLLTHISLAYFLWDIGKQCKIRADTAKRGV